MKKIILSTFLSLLLSGCGGSSGSRGAMIKYSIKYDSTPQSALVICNGIQKGYTPITLRQKVLSTLPFVQTQACKAVWKSGIEVPFESQISRQQFPTKATLTAHHPGGREQSEDIEFDYRKKQDNQINERENIEQQILMGLPFFFF